MCWMENIVMWNGLVQLTEIFGEQHTGCLTSLIYHGLEFSDKEALHHIISAAQYQSIPVTFEINVIYF